MPTPEVPPTADGRPPIDPARVAAPLATGAPFRPVALALLTLALVGLCAYLTLPLLPAVAWAVALAIIAWPAHDWVRRRVPDRGLAAALSATAVALLILAGTAFITYELAREAASAADRAREEQAEGTVRDALTRTPAAGAVGWLERLGVNVDNEARKLVGRYTQDVSGLVQGSLMGVFQFAVAMFILFHLFRDPQALLGGLRRVLPMTRAEADRVFARFADSVHANLYADLITSLIDAVTGGLLFWAVGLPSPVLWGVVMFVLSLVPMLGIFIVWVPAAAYLALSGQTGPAVAVVAWGVASAVLVDNLLYVRLAGDRMRLHQVPALLAFLGGLAVFGASGMILGPAIWAVTVAVLEVWHARVGAADGRRAEEPVPERAPPPGVAGAWVGP